MWVSYLGERLPCYASPGLAGVRLAVYVHNRDDAAVKTRRSSLIGCFSALCLHVSQLRPGLYCFVFVFTAVLLTCCVY